jgi:uncharacterized protein (UPF0332 family)
MHSIEFLIYCSLLDREQYRQLRNLAAVQSDAIDMARIDQAMRECVDQRLELADSFITFAGGLQSAIGAGSNIAARNAVSRAYYAVHHALRALLLFEEHGDVDGHREAIEAIYGLLKRNPAARAKLGEEDIFRKQMLDLLAQRHLSDYYPYGTNAPKEPPADFMVLAAQAIPFALRIVEKTREYIVQKEAGVI